MNTFLKQLYVCISFSICIATSAYAETPITSTNVESSVEELRHKAEQGDARAQYLLGRHYDPNYNEYMGIIGNPIFYYNQNAFIKDFIDFNPNQTDFEEAVKWYLKAAEQGNSEAQRNLGLSYLAGSGLGYAKIAKWLRKAAEKEDPIAQYHLGRILCWHCYHYTGAGEYASDIKRNDREAAKWFEQAAKKGHPGAQYMFAAMLYEGRGVKKNYDEALKWIEKAVSNNEVDAKFVLGHMYYEGRSVKQNFSKALKWYREAIIQSQNDSSEIAYTHCYLDCSSYGSNIQLYTEVKMRLGNMYFSGQGVEQDYIEAYRWYFQAFSQESFEPDTEDHDYRIALENFPIAREWTLKAAEQGNISAQKLTNTGCYSLRQDAAKCFREAAEQGNVEAQLHFGSRYACEDKSDSSSYHECIEAKKWLKKNAEQGNIRAMLTLARKFSISESDVIKWLALVAEKGHMNAWISLTRFALINKNPEAQFALGQLFSEGCCLGVRKNEANALKLFQMAAKQGYEPAIQAIKSLKGRK